MLDRIFAYLLCAALELFPALAFAQSPIGAFPPGAFQSSAALTGSGALPGPPTPTFISIINSIGSGVTQTASFTISAGAQYLVIIGATLNSNPGAGGITGTITPNVGTAVSLISDDASPASNNVSTYIAHAVLLADANTATSLAVSITFPGNPFKNSAISAVVAPSAGFVSTTPTGTAHATPATNTALSTTVATSLGGFIFAVGGSTNTTTNSGAFTGSGLTFATNNNSVVQSLQSVESLTTAGVTANGSQGVTLTYTNSAAMGFSVVAWR